MQDFGDVYTAINVLKAEKEAQNKGIRDPKKKKGLQPLVFAIGSSELELTSFIAYADDQTYEFKVLLDAMSFCFQTVWMFNWKYQEECFTLWRFIERYFFEMEGKWDIKIITNLINIL